MSVTSKGQISAPPKEWYLTFTVYGEPKSWKRAVPIGFGRVEKAKKNTGYQTQVKWSAKAVMTHERLHVHEGALNMVVLFYFLPPTSWPKYKRAQALMNELPCVVRLDSDNLIKNIADGLNGIAYVDDHQLVDVRGVRLWAEKPRAEVHLSPWRPAAALQRRSTDHPIP